MMGVHNPVIHNTAKPHAPQDTPCSNNRAPRDTGNTAANTLGANWPKEAGLRLTGCAIAAVVGRAVALFEIVACALSKLNQI
jgi:hypothetical protein